MTRWTMQKLSLRGCKCVTNDTWAWTIAHYLYKSIAHGHGDEKYAQYSNELWPNDPNFTIRSLLWLLWTLEVALVLEPKLLF
jgi:hypothetical protein